LSDFFSALFQVVLPLVVLYWVIWHPEHVARMRDGTIPQWLQPFSRVFIGFVAVIFTVRGVALLFGIEPGPTGP